MPFVVGGLILTVRPTRQHEEPSATAINADGQQCVAEAPGIAGDDTEGQVRIASQGVEFGPGHETAVFTESAIAPHLACRMRESRVNGQNSL